MKTCLLILLFPLLSGRAHCAQYDATAPDFFLDYASGARALGMGGAQAASTEGPASLLWNPAALALPDRSKAAFNYVKLYEGASVSEAGIAHSMKAPFGIGLSAIHYSISGAETRDASNNLTGTFGDERTAVLAGVGYQYAEWLTLGATGKYLTRSMAGETASAYDFDAGLLASFRRFTAGFQLRNILEAAVSREGGSDKLPRTLRLGISARILSPLRLCADVIANSDGTRRFAAGAEYNPIQWLAVRAGYDGNFVAFGAGLSVRDVTIDYAFIKHEIFGLSHRMSLSFSFGLSKERKRATRYLNSI